MKKLNSFFDKMKEFLPVETKVREILMPIFLEKYKIPLSRDKIRVIKKTLHIYAEPVVKQKLKMREEEILKLLEKNGIFLNAIS